MLEKRVAPSRVPVKARVTREADYSAPVSGSEGGATPTALPKALWRRRWPVLLCMLAALGVSVYLLRKATPLYSSEAKLYVQQSGPRITNESVSGGQSAGYLLTQCELIQSTAILEAALGKPGVSDATCLRGVDNPVAYLKLAIDALPAKQQVDVISVTMTAPDPNDAAVIVNAVVAAYEDYNFQRQRNTSAEVLKILQKEKDRYEQAMTDTSHAMVEFKKANPALAFETEAGNVVSVRLGVLSNALNQAQLKTLELSVINQAADALATDPEKFRSFMKTESAKLSPELEFDVSIAREIRNTERGLTAMEGPMGLGRQHPSVVAAKASLATMEQELKLDSATFNSQQVEGFRGVLRQQLESAKLQESELRKAVESERGSAVDLNVKSAEYQQLAREYARTEKVLDMLDSRIKEVRLVEDSGGLNITELESGKVNPLPVSPVKTQFLAKGLVAGLIVGVGLALLLEFLDQRLRSADEISQQLDLPILGTVPHILGKQTNPERGQEIHLKPRSDVAEAYRTIRTAVFFGLPDDADKTVLVTSPAPGDGKSTTASNLAIAMAQAGRRVLLIDADCRKPVQHKVFKINADHGLSTVLLGTSPLASAVQRTSLENIDFLPCGPLPPNPAELLDSQAFIDLLNEVALKYDNVVIDSPPVVPVTDARIIAASCDATVLVLRAEKSTRRVSVHAAEVLAAIGANTIGLIVNDVARGRDGYGYYAGYGQYRYGYGTSKAAPATAAVREIEAVGAHDDEPPTLPDESKHKPQA